jgi:hypothetical protein
LDGDEQVRAEQEQPAPVCVRTLDPMTGSCDLAADCGGTLHQTRGQMTAQQVANVDALKAASAEFTAMRRLAMRFRGLLRGGTPERRDAWLIDARVWDGSTRCKVLRGRYARTWRPFGTLRGNLGAMGRPKDKSTN